MMEEERDLNLDAPADVMIISSYGAVYPQQVKIAKKVVPVDNTGTDRLVLAREEMDWLMDLYKQDEKVRIVYSYSECGAGLQMSRDYYINRMRKLFTDTKKDCIVLFYTGNSEEGSGNWCFKDGVISFQDIYDLYIECFKGKRLAIISDCSYSGRWVKDCVKIYDDQGIPSCGHHSREKGILIKVLTSCKSYQQATMMAFVKEAMKMNKDRVLYYSMIPLLPRQVSTSGDFHKIWCDKQPGENCQFIHEDHPQYTWKKKLFGGINVDLLADKVYLFRGISKGKPAWHIVRVQDEYNIETLKAEELEASEIDLRRPGWNLEKSDYDDKILRRAIREYNKNLPSDF